MFAPGEIEQAQTMAEEADGIQTISAVPESEEGAFTAKFNSSDNAEKYAQSVKQTLYTLVVVRLKTRVTVSP